MNRCDFLRRVGAMAMVAAAGWLAGCVAEPPKPLLTGSAGNSISIVTDSGDAIVVSPTVQSALAKTRKTLMTRGFSILMCTRLSDAGRDDLCLVVATGASAFAHDLGATVPDAAGAPVIAFGQLAGRDVVLASGKDEAGLAAALMEIGTRVEQAADPHTALRPAPPALMPAPVKS